MPRMHTERRKGHMETKSDDRRRCAYCNAPCDGSVNSDGVRFCSDPHRAIFLNDVRIRRNTAELDELRARVGRRD